LVNFIVQIRLPNYNDYFNCKLSILFWSKHLFSKEWLIGELVNDLGRILLHLGQCEECLQKDADGKDKWVGNFQMSVVISSSSSWFVPTFRLDAGKLGIRVSEKNEELNN
jgi:hypothetical protein